MGIAGTKSRIRWKAAIDKASEILGDVEPLSITCRDEVTVQIRHKEFLRLFVGRPCTKRISAPWVYWSHTTDGVVFKSCEKIADVCTRESLQARPQRKYFENRYTLRELADPENSPAIEIATVKAEAELENMKRIEMEEDAWGDP